MHFRIAVFVFLFCPFFWLLPSALLTISATVARVLFFSALFPATFPFLLPHLSFYFFLYSLTGYTPHPTTGPISLKLTLHICLFLPIIFALAKTPVISELSSFFPAEVLTSKEAFLLSLPFYHFTATFSVSLSLFSTTNTTISKLPLCFFFQPLPRLSSLNFP